MTIRRLTNTDNPIINEGTIKLGRNLSVQVEARGTRTSYPFPFMEVKDFFDVALEKYSVRPAAYQYARINGVKFVTRTIHNQETGYPAAFRIVRVG